MPLSPHRLRPASCRVDTTLPDPQTPSNGSHTWQQGLMQCMPPHTGVDTLGRCHLVDGHTPTAPAPASQPHRDPTKCRRKRSHRTPKGRPNKRTDGGCVGTDWMSRCGCSHLRRSLSPAPSLGRLLHPFHSLLPFSLIGIPSSFNIPFFCSASLRLLLLLPPLIPSFGLSTNLPSHRHHLIQSLSHPAFFSTPLHTSSSERNIPLTSKPSPDGTCSCNPLVGLRLSPSGRPSNISRLMASNVRSIQWVDESGGEDGLEDA